MTPHCNHATLRWRATGFVASLIVTLALTAPMGLALDGVKSVKITNTRVDWLYIEELRMLNADAVDVASAAFGTTATSNDGAAFGSTVGGAIDDVVGAACCGSGWHSTNEFTVQEYTITFPTAQNLEGDITMWDRQDLCCPERMDGMLFQFFNGDNGAGLLLAQVQVDGLGVDAGDADGASFPVPPPLPDTDGDGLPDIWETDNGLDPDDDGKNPNNNGVAGDPDNGADGDPDMDGLPNIGEYANLADPNDPDSDGDTLEDGAEVAGAGARPPTSPANADTDGDTLTDLVETNTGNFISPNDTGSDPTSVDTDMDRTTDDVEVARGTDPSDPSSGGNLSVGQPVAYLTAAGVPTGAWGGLPVSNVTDGVLSSISHPLDELSADYYCEIDLGADFPIGLVEVTGRGFRDDCCAGRLEDATLVILDSALNEVFRQVLPGQIILTQAVDLSAAPPQGRYVRVVNTRGATYSPQLGELTVFAASGSAAPFEITAVSADPTTAEVSLTFNSTPGASYTLFATSSAREGTWEELNDAVPSGGSETTYEFTDVAGAGQPVRLYRLREN